MLSGKQEAKMAFVVRADTGKPGEGTFQVDKMSGYAALETALGLVEQGMTGVTIKDKDGRIFTQLEFADFLRGWR
jgi:hypothetical protein